MLRTGTLPMALLLLPLGTSRTQIPTIVLPMPISTLTSCPFRPVVVARPHPPYSKCRLPPPHPPRAKCPLFLCPSPPPWRGTNRVQRMPHKPHTHVASGLEFHTLTRRSLIHLSPNLRKPQARLRIRREMATLH